MALQYSELNQRDKRPLDEDELRIIDEVEKYIDSEIINQFKTSNTVSIFLGTARFSWDPINKCQRTGIKPIRASKMHDELVRRYRKAKWTVDYRIDDGLEGNLSGADYMILKGNRA